MRCNSTLQKAIIKVEKKLRRTVLGEKISKDSLESIDTHWNNSHKLDFFVAFRESLKILKMVEDIFWMSLILWNYIYYLF